MLIMGLNFGHDASVSIIKDGQVITNICRERTSRVKHAMGLEAQLIAKALDDANLKANELDYCAITSTQGVELIIDDLEAISILPGPNQQTNNIPCSLEPHLAPVLKNNVMSRISSEYSNDTQSLYTRTVYESYLSDFKHHKKLVGPFTGWLDEYIYSELWVPPKKLGQLASAQFNKIIKSKFLSNGFHFPASIKLWDQNIPAFFINHHMCHASSSYYQSGFSEAAILVQDGGSGYGYDSGMFYYGQGNKIYPITPHHSIIGAFYEMVALYLNLGKASSGKLMGLAAYGKPVFYDSKFVGNRYDFMDLTKEDDIDSFVCYWLDHCLSMAKKMGYDVNSFADTENMLAPINIDLAASTQKLFEENTLELVRIVHKYLLSADYDVKDLCLSGGNALNCPTNTLTYLDGRFKNVFIEPGCDDSGLAIGGALNLYHNILDLQLVQKSGEASTYPFMGHQIKEKDVLSAVRDFAEFLDVIEVTNPVEDAAFELSQNKIVGWCQGKSELGPRALGNRSILADPRCAENWERVNSIKKRESWRPFAPVVLLSEAHKWFSDTQLPSKYMLFNAKVASNEIPAIKHFDGSARIQTVDKDNPIFYELITKFYKLTQVPVLLNTSYNGPAEPIVDTPLDAIRFFVNSKLDFLYIDKYKIIHNKEKVYEIEVKKEYAEHKLPKFDTTFLNKAIKSRRESLILIEPYKNFNIIRYQRNLIGISKDAGKFDYETLEISFDKLYAQNLIIKGDTLESIKSKIDLLGVVSILSKIIKNN